MKTISYVFLLGSVFLISCGNTSRSNSEYEPGNDYSITEIDEEDGRGGYDEDSDAEEEGTLDIGNIRLTGRIETCNKCMGYGSVQDGLYGQPQICKFCWISTNMRVQQGWTGFDGRYGQVDAVFNTLPTNYFDDLDWNTGGEYDNNGGTSADQIESEIARHEKSIAQLEHQLEYIEGSINRTQIERQIIEERYEIKRLKAMLNND
jgi:hypothetical protein